MGSGELIFSSGDDVQILRAIAMCYRSRSAYRFNNLAFDEWTARMQGMLVETTFSGQFGDPTSAAELDLLMTESESSTIETRNLREIDVPDDPDPERDRRTKRFYRYLASIGETVYILPPKWTGAVLLGSYVISRSLENTRHDLAASRLVDFLRVGSQEQQDEVKTEISVLRTRDREQVHAAQIYEQLIDHYQLAARHHR